MTLQPGQTLLHYRLGQMIGQGGMGAVYRATDTKLNREVALKVLPAEMADDPARLQRFQREAQAVAALNHPNIVTIFNVEEDRDVHFLIMELVGGTSLDRMLTPGGLPLPQVFDIGIALADALAAAHDKGVVHRDLKPANVMVTPDGRIKVLDFGLAKLAVGSAPAARSDPEATSAATAATPGADSLTREGTVMGTAPYMSPEQLTGKAVNHRTDIFALGVVLYEMCTGRRPFAGESSAELVSSIMRDAPRPVTDMRQDVPRHLGRIIGHCLEKGVTDRYQSALDIRNELRSLRKEVESGALATSGVVLGSGPVPATAAMPSVGASIPGQVTGTQPSSAGVSAPVTMTSGIHVSGGKGLLWGALGGAAIVAIAVAAFWFGSRSGSGDTSTPVTDAAAASAVADAGVKDVVAAAVATKETNSLAVLPFADRSPAGDQEYFTDGLSEELMNALGRIPDLRVAGRTSSFSFKGKDVPLEEIGERLNVANILEGSVRKAGDQIRVSVQLVKAGDGFQLWSETYDRTLDDIFAVQDDIARSVAAALEVTLLGGGATASEHPRSDTYDLVMQARFVLRGRRDDESIARARALLEKALEDDPEYAPAWSELGLVHLREYEQTTLTQQEGWVEKAREASEKARNVLQKALEIDPDLAEAHSRMAGVLRVQDWDFEGALRATERSLEADPTNLVVMGNAGALYSMLGRVVQAIALQERVVERDPLDALNHRNLAAFYTEARRWSDAEAHLRTALTLIPDDPVAYNTLSSVLRELGRMDEARQASDRFLELIGNDPGWQHYLDAIWAHFEGDTTRAETLMLEYEQKYCDSEPSSCALFYALRRMPHEVFAWLEKSLLMREPGLPDLESNQDFDFLRDDPRWEPFWQKVGFPPES